jgi:hypothetical protein
MRSRHERRFAVMAEAALLVSPLSPRSSGAEILYSALARA